MEEEILYRVEIESIVNRQLLLNMVGKRDTVIEASMRVILDCAPSWDSKSWTKPMFGITATKIK